MCQALYLIVSFPDLCHVSYFILIYLNQLKPIDKTSLIFLNVWIKYHSKPLLGYRHVGKQLHQDQTSHNVESDQDIYINKNNAKYHTAPLKLKWAHHTDKLPLQGL